MLIVEDSAKMTEQAEYGKSEADFATEAVRDLVMDMQGRSLRLAGFRYLLNFAKFAGGETVIAESQRPNDGDLENVVFYGNSGRAHNLALVLDWVAMALERALVRCRNIPTYDESKSPPLVVIILSDGESFRPELAECAARLRAIPFQGNSLSVINFVIGMKAGSSIVIEGPASGEEMRSTSSRLNWPSLLRLCEPLDDRRYAQFPGFAPWRR